MDATQPALLAQPLRQALGRAKALEHSLEVSERHEGALQIQVHIQGLFHGLSRFLEMTERGQRLLEAEDRLARRASRDRLAPRPPRIRRGLLP
jgi:hypothetical protein